MNDKISKIKRMATFLAGIERSIGAHSAESADIFSNSKELLLSNPDQFISHLKERMTTKRDLLKKLSKEITDFIAAEEGLQ